MSYLVVLELEGVLCHIERISRVEPTPVPAEVKPSEEDYHP